jgi:alkylhydroperoxidase family enzyme
MNPDTPRVPPLAQENFTEEQAAIAKGWEHLNFTRTMVQHPALYRSFMPFAEQLMRGTSLTPRERQILILRTLALCGETYEAGHHTGIGRAVGLTDAEIEAARTGGAGLSPFEQALVRAAGELVGDRCVGDTTWRTLAERYSTPQLMEVVMLVGNYTLLSMATKSFGMQLEESAS